jgi:tetratricopeptide (TPR) repeat protein
MAVQALVDAYLVVGRRTAEPRYFGRAESVLASWLVRTHPPEALTLRMADIWQYRHEYARALALIERVLIDNPHEPQALLMRAAIRQTQGRFDLAHADCRTLLANGEPTLGMTCLAQTLSMTGSLTRAERMLASLLERSRNIPPAQRVWMLTALADMEERLGDADVAEVRLREALRLDPYAHYARLALGDFLLDRGRAAEIAALLALMPRTEGVLLRLAEAERQLSSSRSEGVELQARFQEAAARGERLHRRDLARLHLRVTADARAALALARENWQEQHEPADARLLAQAALALRDSATLAQLREWRRRTGYEDQPLDRILERAGET